MCGPTGEQPVVRTRTSPERQTEASDVTSERTASLAEVTSDTAASPEVSGGAARVVGVPSEVALLPAGPPPAPPRPAVSVPPHPLARGIARHSQPIGPKPGCSPPLSPARRSAEQE